MNISQNGIDLIKKFENFSSKPYICPAGKKTIGYGHVILPHETFGIISIKEAEEILKADLLITEKWICKRVEVPLSQNQFDALCSLVFNIGIGNFVESTLLKKLNKRDYAGAATEFDRWIYSKGKKLIGLVTRRTKEKELFLKCL